MQEPIALDLVVKLCKALTAKRIDYCHWKSNVALDRSASGENDLDLLINRSHARNFTEILSGLGFKETLAAEDEKLPGVQDYYGLDQPSGRLVHVHAHYQLILGSDLSKNYRLPLEKIYLASSFQNGLFRVPATEFELAVLVIRMMLKHSTWDSILMRHGQLSKSERRELEYLSTQETLNKVDEVLEYLPNVNRTLFDECLKSLQPGCPVWTRVKAGGKLQKALRACARRPHAQDIFIKFYRRISQPIQQRIFKQIPKGRFANGGLFIAIVGGDGAGKTTLIDGLYDWLSEKFEIRKLHMGKPAWSLATVLLRGLLKIGTVLHLYSFEGDVYEESLKPHGLPWFIRAVCTAHDRYLTYLQARRLSSNGSLVLCDRYSLPGFMTMDGPQCESALKAGKIPKRLILYLSRLEAFYYQQIKLPDVLIVLKLDPEVAVRRKTDETEESVRVRSTEVRDLDWEKMRAQLMDASQAREEVLSAAKQLIWSNL